MRYVTEVASGPSSPKASSRWLRGLAVGSVALRDQPCPEPRGQMRGQAAGKGLTRLAGGAGWGVGVGDVVERVLMGVVRHAGPEADVGEREGMKAAVIAERAISANGPDPPGLLAAGLEAGHAGLARGRS